LGVTAHFEKIFCVLGDDLFHEDQRPMATILGSMAKELFGSINMNAEQLFYNI
jgi:hypothetical protein